jgi:protein-S-isoprenylcysteine O-methyltransferase Ste14
MVRPLIAERIFALLGSGLFLALAPGTVAGLVPWWIGGWRTVGEIGLPGLCRPLGVAVGLIGVVILVECFARFAFVGVGTPAPVAPPRKLVASGLYRYVRNPMYVGVVALILAQAAWFGDPALLLYAAAVALAFHLMVVCFEEPILAAKFGADYAAYRKAVPRWLPRPWR